jgi:hypothetical protein
MVDALRAVTSIDQALEYSTFCVTNEFATDMFTFVQGQPLVWRDLLFSGGVDSGRR